MQDAKKILSVIVPCFNESSALPIFYESFSAECAKIPNVDFQLVLVEDGSTDDTLEQMKKLSDADTRVKYISLSRNFGKESAMRAGLEFAKGDFYAIMDVDLQDPPSLIPQMISALESGLYDCVATKRSDRSKQPFLNRVGAKYFYKMLNAFSPVKFVDGARDFRMFTPQYRQAILELPEYNRFTKGIYEWIGFRTKWIEFGDIQRSAGQTKWSMWGLTKYSFDAITSFSTVPLAMVSVLGAIFCAVSALMIGVLSIRQLIYHNSAFGWTSMICVIFFLSGLQLFCIGTLGYYMSKIYLETKKRPVYIVREKNI